MLVVLRTRRGHDTTARCEGCAPPPFQPHPEIEIEIEIIPTLHALVRMERDAVEQRQRPCERRGRLVVDGARAQRERGAHRVDRDVPAAAARREYHARARRLGSRSGGGSSARAREETDRRRVAFVPLSTSADGDTKTATEGRRPSTPAHANNHHSSQPIRRSVAHNPDESVCLSPTRRPLTSRRSILLPIRRGFVVAQESPRRAACPTRAAGR